MHRHGYKGRKFGREKDQRKALIKGLADSLIMQERIETTIAKAKEVVPYTEKLITRAKKGGLHNRRQVITGLNTLQSAHKLVDELAPRLKNRNSGYFRVKKSTLRRGDNTQMATVSFVDDLKQALPATASSKQQTASKSASSPKTAAKKPSKKAKTTDKKAAKK